MNSIDKLIQIFSEFPGIGPKQARRFVYYLITKNDSYIEDLKREITELHKDIESCADCRRYFNKNNIEDRRLCNICSDKTRDTTSLLLVSRDIDLENIEKSHTFTGKYFVLGGLIPILDKNPEQKIRLKDLLALVSRMSERGLKEIILGLDANSEAEYTGDLLKTFLAPLTEKYSIKISELGRGLSTGTELEYSDPETIKSALNNRK
jgi:recombination protein RecR